MGLVMLTNLPWIPAILYSDFTLRKRQRLEAGSAGLAV